MNQNELKQLKRVLRLLRSTGKGWRAVIEAEDLLEKIIDTRSVDSEVSSSKMECPDCDGVGWVESMAFLHTTCKRCHGTGVINKPRKRHIKT